MKRTISEIYETYHIPPWLQEHMYRVAAVSAQLFDALKEKHPELEGRHDLITANLLHDAGNIIKFDFVKMPSPDGRDEYWQGIQKAFNEKFGTDELVAAEKIMQELGVFEKTFPILEHTSFPYAHELLASGTVLQKISALADQRVNPTGVVSMSERFEYMHRRYAERGSVYGDTEDPKIKSLSDALFAIEAELYDGLSIRPEDITDASVAPIIQELKSFEI